MPDVLEPPKIPFAQRFAAERPKDEAELKAMQSGTATAPVQQTPPKPDPAPPKSPEAKAAPALGTPDPDQEILEGKRTPKNDDFKRVKNAASEASKRADELKAKLEAADKERDELRKAPKHNAELIKKIESERDELQAKWQLVAAQFDSGFHAKYEAKVTDAIAKIKDAVPADRMNDLSQVIQMPEGDRKRKILAELTEDLDAPTITDIMIANREVRDILSSRKKELEDSGTILKTSAEQRKKEQDERKAAYAQSFDAVLKKKSTGDDALPILQTRDGDADWNTGVAERAAVARAVFMDEFESPEEKAEAAIWAASAPGFLSELKAAQTENATLKETLAKLQSASPGLGGGGKGSEGGKKMTFTERAIANAI